MLRIRIKFKKTGVMKFIGHLDIMRYFQKCMRRSSIAITYSEGFSPHQIMSFAAPLGVGITSEGEYLDIEVSETNCSNDSIRALNQVMVEGIEITSYRRLNDTDTKAMALVAAADYELSFKEGYEVPAIDWENRIREFYEAPEEILITKKTKKSEKIMDLKQLVYAFQVSFRDKHPVFYLNVCTGSTDNVKPELVLSTFFTYIGLDFEPYAFQIHRLDVYGEIDGVQVSLGEMGDIIE